MNTHHPVRGMRKQRGLVAVIVTIALFSFMGVAALAIDINHALMNRTKLQNSVDAAALAAALVLDRTDFTSGTNDSALSIATNAAQEALNRMASENGNTELDFVTEPIDVLVTLSNSPTFVDSYSVGGDDHYVRVAVSNLQLSSFIMQLFGLNKQLSASAVAGPSAGGGSCNLVPMAVCATDGGYQMNQVYALKLTSNTSSMGVGNFQLLDFDPDDPNTLTEVEKYKLSELLAGAYEGCAIPGKTVTSKPGNTIGPVADGLNTRFGLKSNLDANDYPQDTNYKEAELNPTYISERGNYGLTNQATLNDVFDLITEASIALETNLNPKNNKELTEPEIEKYENIIADYYPLNAKEDLTLDYDRYVDIDNTAPAPGDGRRVLAVPIIDCPEGETGKSEYAVVDIGCFFLLQHAPLNSGDKQEIFGEYFGKCPTSNVMYNGESNSLGTYRIVLYDDPFNKDS